MERSQQLQIVDYIRSYDGSDVAWVSGYVKDGLIHIVSKVKKPKGGKYE